MKYLILLFAISIGSCSNQRQFDKDKETSVEFVKWDDVSKPIIKFSEDGTLAHTIVGKIVKVRYRDETGETIESKTHFAWSNSAL